MAQEFRMRSKISEGFSRHWLYLVQEIEVVSSLGVTNNPKAVKGGSNSAVSSLKNKSISSESIGFFEGWV
jgi:hypothetical protein